MNASQQTISQIERALRAAIETYGTDGDGLALPCTDILVQASQDTGEMVIADEDGKELGRAVIDAWAGNTSDTFYDDIQPALQQVLGAMQDALLKAGIMKPYDFLLCNDDGETVANIYSVLDDTLVLTDDMIRRIDEDLDAFFENLMKS